MRTQLARTVTTISAVATLLLTTAAQAQPRPLGDTPSYLVAGMSQGQNQPVRSTAANGFGFGVKGGPLFSSFREARTDYKSSGGWQGGLFVGGNRAGALGVQTELTYAKRGAKTGSTSTDTYYLEVPLLLRMNVGSSNRNSGASLYFFAGPAADILLKAELEGIDVKDQFKALDWNVIAGAGVEISRFLIEGRFNWGLANVLDGPGNELKTQSFAILGGFRFN